jgi:hypothetical protein
MTVGCRRGSLCQHSQHVDGRMSKLDIAFPRLRTQQYVKIASRTCAVRRIEIMIFWV